MFSASDNARFYGKNLASFLSIPSSHVVMDVTTAVLSILIFAAISAAALYFIGIEPGRMVERWLTALTNDEKLPERPNLGLRFWLYPIHRECLAVAKRMNEMRTGVDSVESKLAHVEFMQNFVLGSVTEGIMVVDENLQITLVNSELLTLFQLSQSPLRRTVRQVGGDEILEGLIQAAFSSGEVQMGRITRQFSLEGGRPPAFEVNAIPIRTSATRISSVLVLFMTPADRNRAVQALKRHAEKIHRLAKDWTANGRVLLRSSVADLSELEIPDKPSPKSGEGAPSAGASTKN